MAQNLVVAGDTYEGVERVAATNAAGEVVIYPEGENAGSDAVKYVAQKLTEEEQKQARDNIDALGHDDIFFRYIAHEYGGKTEKLNTITINVKKVVDGQEVVESVELDATTLYEHAKLHGYSGTVKEFYDTLAQNTQTLKADGLWFDNEENRIYLTSGGNRIGEGVTLTKKEGDVWLVKISGSFETGYAVTMGDLPAPRDGLDVLVGRGDLVTGVAVGNVIFPYLADVPDTIGGNPWPDKKYTLPSGTVFSYNNGSFFAKYNSKTYIIESRGDGWGGEVVPEQYVFQVIDPYKNDGCSFEYDGEAIPMDGFSGLVYDAVLENKLMLCYQKDAVFKFEDGSTYKPPLGTPFFYNEESEVFRCEVDGIECNAHVLLYGFRLTAKKTTPYQAAESKADNLEYDADAGSLFLMSAGERIGDGIPLTAQAADNTYVTDWDSANYAEINAAHNAGKACFVKYGDILCAMIALDDEQADFLGMLRPDLGYMVTVPVSGNNKFQQVRSNALLTVAQNLTDDQKAQARSNIGALAIADTTPIYIADQLTATYAEVKAAYDAGKKCFLLYQSNFLGTLIGVTDTAAKFRVYLAYGNSKVVSVNINGTTDSESYYLNAVQYSEQSLTDEEKTQARSNIGAVGYIAPANVAGTEQVTAKLYTSNGGSIAFGKEGPNSGTMIRLDQVDGTCRLRFRASATAGAIVWEQPEQGAQLYIDLGKQGVDKRRITFPAAAGTLALTSQIPSLSGYLPLSGGLMTGSLKFQAASLPGKSLQYICGVDAFTNGGEMGWQSKADFLSGYATTDGNVNTSTMPLGFSSRQTNGNWGNTDGTTVTCWIDPTGGGIDFRRDNPSSGKLSIKLDGRVYVNEGKNPVMGTEFANGYWGVTSPDGENNVWIRTTTQGIIPYRGGAAGAGHCSLGTANWYFASAYIDNIHGTSFSGLAAKATADGNGNNIASTYLPKSGGTMAGPLWITGGDSATAGKLILNNDGRGQITDSGSSTLFGFVSTGNLTVGHGYYNLVMRGKASRPTYNGANVALVSDVVAATNGPLRVTISGDATNGYTADTTHAEILNAFNSGYYVYAVHGNHIYSITSANGISVIFTTANATTSGLKINHFILTGSGNITYKEFSYT